MNIELLFSATKAMIRNDEDPFGEQPMFPGTQWNTKGSITTNMMN